MTIHQINPKSLPRKFSLSIHGMLIESALPVVLLLIFAIISFGLYLLF